VRYFSVRIFCSSADAASYEAASFGSVRPARSAASCFVFSSRKRPRAYASSVPVCFLR
jgi:hypothetical protein